MSVKQKLSEIEADKALIEKEILEFIQNKISNLQTKHKIAVSRVYIDESTYPQTLYESLTQPKFVYIRDVEIDIDKEEYILRNVD